MDFTLEVEDEIIRDSVSQRLDIPLVNLSNKFWRYSKQTKTYPSYFQIGDSLRYTNEGQN